MAEQPLSPLPVRRPHPAPPAPVIELLRAEARETLCGTELLSPAVAQASDALEAGGV